MGWAEVPLCLLGAAVVADFDGAVVVVAGFVVTLCVGTKDGISLT